MRADQDKIKYFYKYLVKIVAIATAAILITYSTASIPKLITPIPGETSVKLEQRIFEKPVFGFPVAFYVNGIPASSRLGKIIEEHYPDISFYFYSTNPRESAGSGIDFGRFIIDFSMFFIPLLVLFILLGKVVTKKKNKMSWITNLKSVGILFAVSFAIVLFSILFHPSHYSKTDFLLYYNYVRLGFPLPYITVSIPKNITSFPYPLHFSPAQILHSSQFNRLYFEGDVIYVFTIILLLYISFVSVPKKCNENG